MNEKQLKREIQESKVTIRIGHNSEIEKIVFEIMDQMNSKKIIKIKANKGVLDSSSRKLFWNELAELTDTHLVSKIGNVAVLMKK
tara:strand:+ start:1134 stop:1388 length:255 start_codon:yes stop_codon:yes gene_type:complete